MATKVAFVSRKGGVGKSSGLQNVAAAIRRLRPETGLWRWRVTAKAP